MANLGFGVAGCMASSYSPDFWLAVIVANGVFRVGCGIGHIRAMVQDHNFAINNTSILFLNFAVPSVSVLGLAGVGVRRQLTAASVSSTPVHY